MVRVWLIGMGILSVILVAAFAWPILGARGSGGGPSGPSGMMSGATHASANGAPTDSVMGAHPRAVKLTDNEARTPVVVELFTSEGCSDCPPADAVLEKLDRTQPVAGAQVIALSEHVDYWNDIGWRDPFSSHAYSERQNDYSGHFGLGSVYTPQMVVDGRIQFVGSSESAAIRAIESAARAEKIPVTLSGARFDGGGVTLRVETGAAPTDAALLVVVEDESDTSSVSRGENSGRTLKHVAVVREMSQAATIGQGQTFAKEVSVKFARNGGSSYRVVALVQDPSSGAILGAGSARLSN
ncbi:MAG TPA: DUF1223 domain-containing protein [Candidatus Acidoferrales bacterium]